MKKPILCFLFIFLILACGGSDDNGGDITDDTPIGMDDDKATDGQDNETSMVTINLDGVTDLDLSSLTAVSSSGSAQINSSNELEDIADDESPDLPIIFTNDSNVVMGYFPETLDGEEIQIEDIVFFFFKTFPALAVKRLNDATMKSLLVNSANYETMVGLVKDALNQNIAVTDNPQFDEMVRRIATEYNESAGKTAKDIVAEFKFNYSRDGNIGIPNDAPIFSSLGVQVNQVGSNTPVFGPKLLNTKNLVLSPGSLFNFLLDEFVLTPEPLTENFTLPQDGIYEIIFSNGSSNHPDLDDTVKAQNYKYFGVTVLGYAVPFGLEKLLKNQSCNTEIAGLLEVSRQFAANIVQNGTGSLPEDLIEFITEIGLQTKDLAVCYTTDAGSFSSVYLPNIIGFLNKRLSIAEDVAELSFFAKDFFDSDISGIETRYFKDGISVGHLNETKVSETMFEGQKDETFTYETLIEEKEVKYDVDRAFTTVTSFLQKEEMKPAIGLPFEYSLAGDATISPDNPVISDSDGKVKFDITLGEQDSELTLTPKFESPRISDTPITVEIEDLSSLWYKKELNLTFLPGRREELPSGCSQQEGKPFIIYMNVLNSNNDLSVKYYFKNTGQILGLEDWTSSFVPLEEINGRFGPYTYLNQRTENIIFDAEGCMIKNKSFTQHNIYVRPAGNDENNLPRFQGLTDILIVENDVIFCQIPSAQENCSNLINAHEFYVDNFVFDYIGTESPF